MRRSGTADFPLHFGWVPAWLASRMTTLGTAIAEAVVHHLVDHEHAISREIGGRTVFAKRPGPPAQPRLF